MAMTDSPSAHPRKRTPVLRIGVALAGLLAVVGIVTLVVRVTQHEPEATPGLVPSGDLGEDDTDTA
ncbi:MAG: hypothetical protein H6Q90_7121, partial [Deltaproteobacteria bacterium]|nr:hypothetical protein [Deltaproteobacteria bacterium]